MGQLGISIGGDQITLVKISTETDWSEIVPGWHHTIVLKNNGTIWCSGLNDSGQLGLGDSGVGTNRNSFTQIGSESNWFVAVAGNRYTIAGKTNGSLWVWGLNSCGQLGLGDSGVGTQRTTPTQINSATDWLQISSDCDSNSNESYSVAIKTNLTIWSWGYNEYGQLGLGDNGTSTSRNTPTVIGSTSDWTKVSTGRSNTLALKINGTLWGWGGNWYGQLGLGNINNRMLPTPIGTATDWIEIACGSAHTLSRKFNKTLWVWGFNYYGQLGLGDSRTGTNRTTPTQLNIDLDWSTIRACSNYTITIKTNGTIWAWGSNTNGRLGLGDTIDRNVPTLVGE
jgi:alpha-tubulin suppressor-like RCC1 family protein